jgi:hypothetical protein
MMKGAAVQKILTILLPLLSVMVSAGIVHNQYSRDGEIERRLLAARREKEALLRLLPANPNDLAPANRTGKERSDPS